MKRILIALSFAAVLLLVPSAGGMTATTTVTVERNANFGRILVDAAGRPFYLFTKDGKGPSRCYGECAKAWPPFLAKGKLVTHGGAFKKYVGTVKRRDGTRQVTYKGQPLYYWVGDPPHEVRCQNATEFGGKWLILRTSGKPVT